MALFEKKDAAKPLPRHIAIIMDGNGRWAQKRGLPRTAGHAAGSETFRRIATYCKNLGLDYLTVYAFSTENWKRSADEVRAIMALFDKYLHEAIDEMEQDHIRLKILGDLGRIPPSLRALIAKTDEISTHYDGFQANICVNYGGRDEIVHAARQFAQDCVDGKARPEDLSAPRARSARRTFCPGSRRTVNIILQTCSGPTLTRPSWTAPSPPIRRATGGLEA